MMLQALYELAKREGLMADPDFESKPVSWLVRVDEDGRILCIEDNHQEVPGKGKKKPKRIAKPQVVPREPGRTSGEYAFFLCDKAEYALGKDPDERRPDEQLARRFALFRDKLQECAEETGDVAVCMVHKALTDVAEGKQRVELPEGCKGNDLFAFVYAPDVDQLVSQRPAAHDWWKQRRGEKVAGRQPTHRCLVSGEACVPASKHPAVKRVPGGSTSGVAVVSFNAAAFESYGWKSSHNAPVSQAAAEACSTALNRLLDPTWPDPRNPGQTLPKRHLRLSANSVVCYWSREEQEGLADVFAGLLQADAEQVAALYRAVWKGRRPAVTDTSAFYALVLSGAQGRATVRDWIETTVETATVNLARHFEDLALVRNCPPPKGTSHPEAIPFTVLLEALATHGKRENIPDPLVTAFLEAALQGTRYPVSLLQRSLLRFRAEIGRDGWIEKQRRDAQAAMIKAVLRRTFQREVTEAMNPEDTNPGYLFGRLMALIERMQQLALGDVNATVVDRFFSGASATPAAVFPRLLKNSRHHAAKAKDDARSGVTAHWLERLTDEVTAGIDQFPPHLDLGQQGLFVLGYHHQRHALWTKKEKKEEEETGAGVAAEA